MKKIYIIAPAVVVVLVGGALVAPSFVDWNKYKPQAITQIKAVTGYDVALNGDLGLTILPSPRVFIENVEIAAPTGSAEDHLIRVKRLDIHLALAPLLSRKVDFSSVKLVEPDIALEVMANNQQNWMTPELQALTTKDPNAPVKEAPQIALRDVSIEKGRMIYRAGNTAKPTEMTNVNLDLTADTLQGPFDVEGEVTIAGQTIEIDGKTGKLSQEVSKSVSVNLVGSVKPLKVDLKYAGVVGLSEPYDIQGETEIKLSNLKEMTKNSPLNIDGDTATIKGLLTGSKDKAEFKDATIEVAGNELKGDISVNFSPVKVVSKLSGSKIVSLDTLIKPVASKKETAGSKNVLPPTIELPAAFEADIALNVPGLTYKGQSYKNVNLRFVKLENTFTAGFAAGEIPGKGSIDATADLKFASKSLSKTGAEIYSDPTMTGSIKGQTQNIGQTVKAMAGIDNPALDSFKSASINGGFTVAPDVFQMKSATLRLGEMQGQVSAAYSPRGTRPALALDVVADTLNFDTIQQKISGKSANEQTAKANPADALKNLKIPMDIDFDIGVQNAVLQGQSIKGLRAIGTARENALKFSNLSAQDFAGSTFKMEGGISDLANLKGVDVKLAGESKDIKGVAKMAGIDPATLPQNIESAALSLAASGDMAKMGVKASVRALNGELIASGDVGDPLGQIQISKMALQVKHRSMSEAMRIFAPGSPQYASWNKPLDFYADVDTQGKVHKLSNIKADLAGATLTGALSFDQSSAKPALAGDLVFGDLVMVSDPNAAAAVARGADAQSAGAAKSTSRWSSTPINPAWMNAFNVNLNFKAKSLTYETWALSQPSLKLTLENGVLQIKDLKSGIYGGQMAMDATMRSNAGKAPISVDGVAKLDNVQIENLVASLARGTKLLQGTGQVSMDTTIKATGSSQAALVSALSGNGNVSGKNIVLEGFDLVRFGRAMSDENKPKDTLLGLYKTSIKGGTTSFDTLAGNYTINQGVVNIAKMDLDGPAVALTTKGNLNLPAWTIATDHTISLKQNPEIPPFTIKIAGSLDNPGQTFGQGLLQDYFQRKLNTKIEGAITDKLTDKLGGEAGGALGSLLGIKPKAVAPKAVTPTAAPATATSTTPAPAAVAPAEPAPAAIEPAASEIEAMPPAQPAPVQAAPEPTPAPEAAPAPAAEAPAAEPTAEDAMKDVLKGLISQ